MPRSCLGGLDAPLASQKKCTSLVAGLSRFEMFGDRLRAAKAPRTRKRLCGKAPPEELLRRAQAGVSRAWAVGLARCLNIASDRGSL